MSGGVAYVLDEDGDFSRRINMQMVGVERLEEPEEIATVRALVEQHLEYTGSARARSLLESWASATARFIKVIPNDYRRVLTHLQRAHDMGLTGQEAIMAAFEDNARDLARVSGN
jgi:glutamate synthase (ferredoxin)